MVLLLLLPVAAAAQEPLTEFEVQREKKVAALSLVSTRLSVPPLRCS